MYGAPDRSSSCDPRHRPELPGEDIWKAESRSSEYGVIDEARQKYEGKGKTEAHLHCGILWLAGDETPDWGLIVASVIM